MTQDESLIDEMRKTLRADRERAGERRRPFVPAAGAEPAAFTFAPEAERPRRSLLARLARRRRA